MTTSQHTVSFPVTIKLRHVGGLEQDSDTLRSPVGDAS